MTCVKNFEEEKLALVKNWLQLNNFEVTESHFPEDGTVSTDDIVDEQLFEFKDQRRLSGSITDKGRKKFASYLEEKVVGRCRRLSLTESLKYIFNFGFITCFLFLLYNFSISL